MAFIDQVSDYIGTFSDTGALDKWLTSAAKKIVEILPIEKAEKFSADLTDSGSGVSITGHRVLRAHKSNYEAVKVSPGLRGSIADTNSIHLGNAKSPKWCIENGKAYVLPGGGTVIGMAYPTVANGDSSISNFPGELENAVILDASIQGALQNCNTKIANIASQTFTSPTAPTVPSLPVFNYTDVSAATIAQSSISSVTLTPSNITATTITSTSIGSLGTVPTYTKPTFGGVYTNVDTALTAEDVELASGGHLAKVKSQLEQYQLDINNEVNEFNKELAEYQSTVEKALKQAELDQQRLLRQAELDQQRLIQEIANDQQIIIAQGELSQQENISQAQLDQQRLIEYAKNQDVVNLQNEVQELNSQIEQYKYELQRYSEQVNTYGQQINLEVSRYSSVLNRINSELQGMGILIANLKEEYKNLIAAYV